ncbi:phage tail protein [Mucilaginibacter sp.]|jgi:microcystin-dependent protein|uniref:phage tail protein n=1 Tax=Mucilaginibacter sp. TaxID=1882438 RepID=UPI003563F8F2
MEPLIGEIKMFAGNFAPNGWFLCNGALLPINQYSAFFSLLGTTYGGDGVSNFRLPNLQGRVPIQAGQGVSYYNLGDMGGAETVTLNTLQMPSHSHTMSINTEAPTVGLASNAYLGYNANAETGDALPFYSATATAGATLNAGAINPSGSNQPIKILPPYLAINYIIAWQGIWPSRP